MNRSLTIIFFEDHFVCTILPNESAWEALMINGSEKMLLYFYVSGGDIRNDDFAKDRFEANDTNAFGNFYETILRKDRTFRRFDLELEPINLLKVVIEEVKAVYAERIISFIPDFDINIEIPLNICFIPGISREAQEIITNYFLQDGFKLNSKADYFESFVKILQRKGIIANKINLSIVESYFGDLLFHYIEYNDKIIKKESETLIGKGIDHRIGNLAKLMVEKAAHKSSSRLLNDATLLEQEIKKFHRRAAIEINNFYYNDLDVKVELSDFNSARIIIDQRELEKMSAESFQFIKFKYESFISKHSNLARTEKILLNGQVLSSNEFTIFFEKTFGASKVVKPFDNFVELLSRGISALSYVTKSETYIPPQEIEIKITVSTKAPPLPEIKKQEKPAVPEIKKPPLPPLKGNNENFESKQKNEERKIIAPPIPPPTNKPISDNKNKEEEIKETKPKLPPIPPPLPKKKT